MDVRLVFPPNEGLLVALVCVGVVIVVLFSSGGLRFVPGHRTV